ncbi:MAG: glycogen debranching enzyme, partial [Gemmataceae bacterium]|nr:glycogen debranching enzyme [Gemmataceae bacterium]
DGRFTGREPDHDYELDCDFYVALNAWHDAVKFRVPSSPTRRRWRRVVDTARPSPDDFVPEAEAPPVPDGTLYPLAPHALLVLVSEP